VRARIILLVAAAVAALAGDAAAQPANTQPPRWRVDIVGGWAGVTAADLNARVDYETAILDALRSQPVQQTHDGALLELDHASPIGGRVLRRLGGHWSLGAGFSAFSAEQASSATASYRYTVVDPRAQEYQRQFSSEITVDPLMLQAREYFPYARVGYDLALGRRLTIGAALDAGWLFAECELDASEAVVGGFYPTSDTSTVHMSGRGNSFGADALVSARINLTPRWGLLVEGGRAWHDVKNVTGSVSATAVTQDGEATEPELTQTRQADGRWMNRPVQANAGRWQGTVPDIGMQGSPFTLSLSGWQVRFGVSLGL
jgi:hypothetical protein